MTERTTPLLIQKLSPFILFILGLILIVAAGFYLTKNSTLPSVPSAVPVRANYPAPELTLTDTQGVSHSLEDYRGQVVLINLWATWCVPCKEEMPTLQSFYDEYKNKDFVVIAINDGDSQADVVQFVKELDLTFPIWLDPTYRATTEVFKTIGLPTSFVMDRNGTVRFYWVGSIDRKTLESEITPLILEDV